VFQRCLSGAAGEKRHQRNYGGDSKQSESGFLQTSAACNRRNHKQRRADSNSCGRHLINGNVKPDPIH
jgi:hypothetical protein